MQDFEVSPEETLFVGDRNEDLEAARNAGCGFIWAWQFFGEDGPPVESSTADR
jgi:phosphoglycolate phosphatase-like HAD superfamily hydrolase